MNNIPFYLYITLAVLEGIGVFYFLFSFTKAQWTKQQLALIAIIYGFITFFLRKLPISFGVHSLLLICLDGGFVSYFYKVRLSSSLFGAILVSAIIISTEVSIVFLFTNLFAIQYDVILSKPLWWFISGLPHIVLLLLLGLFMKNKE